MATPTKPQRGLVGQTADERAEALTSSDPAVKAAGMSRADLRAALAKAGVVGAANLRREDAARLFVQLTKSGKAPAVRCDAAGKVHNVTGPARAKAPAKKAPAKKKAAAKRAPARKPAATKRGTPKAEGAAPAPPAPAADAVTEDVGGVAIVIDTPTEQESTTT